MQTYIGIHYKYKKEKHFVEFLPSLKVNILLHLQCLGLFKMNRMFSKLYCVVYQNLMALLCFHNLITTSCTEMLPQAMTDSPLCFTDSYKHSLLYLFFSRLLHILMTI